MSNTPHEYAESRRYVCTSCDTMVRARWDQWGDGYPGYFEVGCDCTIVPVVPEMSQAETPDEWRVERPECCRGVDVKDLEECYGGVSDYRCPDCGATYRWDGTMSTAPESEEQPDPPDDQQLLTDGGTDQHVERVYSSDTDSEEPRYKDADLLRELYVERRMSTIDIAEELDCAANTVRKYLKENGIELRSQSEAIQAAYGTENCASYSIRPSGRAAWKSQTDQVFVYRLLAVAEYGFDAVCNKVVHHKNGIKWDDRPDNIELMTQTEHMKRHRKVSKEDRGRIVERYKAGESSYDIAPDFDVCPGTVIDIVREFDPALVRNSGGAKA